MAMYNIPPTCHPLAPLMFDHFHTSHTNVVGVRTADTNQTVLDMHAQQLEVWRAAGADKEQEREAWASTWTELMQAASTKTS